MAYYSGQHGVMSIKRAGTGSGSYTELAKIRDWSVNFQMETLDTTTLLDTDRTKIPGLRTFNGNCNVLYYSTDDVKSDFNELIKHMLDPAKVGGSNPQVPSYGQNDKANPCQMQLQVKQGNEVKTVAFTAYITGFQMTCSTGEVFSAAVTFEGTGAMFTFNY